jgi:hypothetical protein
VNINSIRGRLQLIAAALLFSVAFSSAAIADTGVLQIKVTDGDGNAIAGASVRASTPESLSAKSGTTDADGGLRLMGLNPSENYVITVNAEGYQPARNEGVLVVSERTLNIPFLLAASSETMEEIVTYGRTDLGQLVDTTSALQSTDVTLDVMDSLPTGRTYQSYLQMAPTTKPSIDGNAASKSGVNYSDAFRNGNNIGTSSDNVYYIDGINITDVQTGTFGGNFNSEIIQEQQIITGGVPAEYEGGQGLISRVITKSGGNEFSGSVNYYMQSDGLVSDNENLADAGFDTFDTAITIGGPIIKDKLWFFGSFQRKERDEDIVDPVTDVVQRTVNTTQDYSFLKLTYQPTENDTIIAEFFDDPYERDGSDDITVLANRDRSRVQGGDNYKFEYSHAWENAIVTANFVSHEGEINDTSSDKSTRNDVAFWGVAATNADTDLGGYGIDIEDVRSKESINLTFEYFLDTGLGSHEIKAGYSQTDNERFRDFVYNGGEFTQYTSLGNVNSGMTADDFNCVNQVDPTACIEGWVGAKDFSQDDYQRVIDAMDESGDSAYFLGLLDSSGDGVIDHDEMGQLQFISTAGNPGGAVNVYQIEQTVQNPTIFKTEGDAFYIQDTWSIDDHWTIAAGVRAEKWDHIATDGSRIFTFDYDYAPRLSLIYDLKGDGRSKVWGFYGKYYDPIRTDMTSFAGTLTGSVREEKLFVGNQWLTFRTRGGPQGPDGFFAPTTKTPYTEEIMLGWEHSLTNDQSIAVTYTQRETNDIMEDYDLGFYTDPDQVGGYALPLSYIGFETLPTDNNYISTLAGGVRKYEGVEVTWRKRRSADSRWFSLVSYSYNDAEGNSNSDGNADLQGDFLYLDPRAPNNYGPQPGNTEHMLKLAGSYRWENGIEVGATYLWNSGTLYSETFSQYGRHTPIRVGTAYEDNGVTDQWLAPNSVGSQETPSYGTLNLRAKYVVDFGESMSAEFFLDVFNALDDQAAMRHQDLTGVIGDGVYGFGEENRWVLPRRFYLGARMSF